jgi:hypothetical protein
LATATQISEIRHEYTYLSLTNSNIEVSLCIQPRTKLLIVIFIKEENSDTI